METKHASPRRTLVGVIGDGSLSAEYDADKIELARALGEALVDEGFRVVCGGKSGVMEQVCRGARDSRAYAEGDTIGVLPGGDDRQANEFVDIVIPTSLGHARNGVVAHADAVVAIGGGAGTLSELCFAWIHDRLIIALDVEGWSGRLAGQPVDGRRRFAHIDDDKIWRADSAPKVVSLLRTQLPRYRRG